EGICISLPPARALATGSTSPLQIVIPQAAQRPKESAFPSHQLARSPQDPPHHFKLSFRRPRSGRRNLHFPPTSSRARHRIHLTTSNCHSAGRAAAEGICISLPPARALSTGSTSPLQIVIPQAAQRPKESAFPSHQPARSPQDPPH